jgi:nitrate/nitrite-specific signal transduction histidine kinase
MTGMRERAARWGGTVRVQEVPTGGTRMRLIVPVPAAVPTTDGASWTVTR